MYGTFELIARFYTDTCFIFIRAICIETTLAIDFPRYLVIIMGRV